MTSICILLISISQFLLIVPPCVSSIIKSIRNRCKWKKYECNMGERAVNGGEHKN